MEMCIGRIKNFAILKGLASLTRLCGFVAADSDETDALSGR